MRKCIQPLLLAAAALIAYVNCFEAPFVFDDLRLIVDNPRIRTLWPLSEPLTNTSRPVVQLSLALNYAISGLNVWSYHLLNVLIHFATACAVMGVMHNVLRRTESARVAQNAKPLAFVIALVWMVHPLQTESVTYIIQRGESLAALFCLLTVFCFLRSMEASVARRWRIASVVFCALGVATKPVAVIAPALVLLCDRTLFARSITNALRLRWRYYAVLLVSLAILPVVLAGNKSEWATSAGFGQATVPALQYAAAQPGAILRYLQLVFWPAGFCLDYGSPAEGGFVIVGVETVVILTVFCFSIWALRRRSVAGLAALCFFVALAPSSSFIPVADVLFEHRMYLALAPLLAVVITGAFLLAERLIPNVATRRRILGGALAAATITLTTLTLTRNEEYNSEVLLWSRAIEISPLNARAYYNLGTVLLRHRRPDAAAKALTQALEIRRDYPEAYYNLGNAQLIQDHTEAATQSYLRALAITPDDWQAHNNLGVAMLKSDNVRGAAAEFHQTLLLNPNCESAKANLARLSR
jgi:tetratricopeptide (TPR) repeat protein